MPFFNFTANVSKAIDVLYPYERIHCMLDNDKAGYEATRAIELEYSQVCVTSRTIIGVFGLERLPVRQEAGTEEQQPARRRK